MPETKQYIFNKSEDSKSANILIDGEISAWWGVGLRDMAKDIANSGADNIMMQINSGGGSVFEGMAISAFIKSNPVNISTSILGLCASIATPIALSGKTTSIAKGSLFMIHNASAFAGGEASDLRSTADLLDTIDKQLVNIYVATIEKNGKLINDSVEETTKQVTKWQNDETWFAAEDAVKHGFIQKLTEGVEFLNKTNAQDIINSCSKYKNTPAEFLNKAKTIANMADDNKTVVEKQTEKGMFDLLKNFFGGGAKSEDVPPTIEEPTAAEKLEAAKALVEASGLKIETTAKVEEPAKVETNEDLKAELTKVKAEKEALRIKAQKLEEEKSGAGAASAKKHIATEEKELTEEQQIENLLAPQMESLNAMANSIFKS